MEGSLRPVVGGGATSTTPETTITTGASRNVYAGGCRQKSQAAEAGRMFVRKTYPPNSFPAPVKSKKLCKD